MSKKISGFFKKLKQIFPKYILLLFILLLFINLSSTVVKMKRARMRIDRAQEKLDELSEEKSKLEEQVKFVKSEEFIEKQVRYKLGLAKEGEIVVYLPEDEIVKKLVPAFEEEEETLPDPNWKKWAKLFGVLE